MTVLAEKRWTMTADLRRCVGCQTCTAACKQANATSPAVQWRKVLDVESGVFPNVRRTFVPVGCMHCSDPPCMHVCPSTATKQRADGIVTIDYDLCIGCAYCAVACPYQARFKVQKPRFAYGSKIQNEAQREDPARLGVAQKCTWCSDRIDYGLANGLTPGVDPRATPACVNACIADALKFGDGNDPQSNVSQLLAENQTFRMHENLKTNPGFHYIYQGGTDDNDGPSVDRTEPSLETIGGVEPWLQQHWDWRAAGNFIGGGTGSGLALMGAMAALVGGAFQPQMLLGLLFIAFGLFMVFLETGRPLRAPLNVLFNVKTSWMTREAMLVMALFPLGFGAVFWSSMPLALMAGGFALAFLYAQARILTEAKGIPVWREKSIMPLILSTGLVEGAGLFLVLTSVLSDKLGTFMPLASSTLLVILVARAWTWMVYRRSLEGDAPARALKALDKVSTMYLAVGHVFPIALLIAGPIIPTFVSVTDPIAGLVACGFGWMMKFVIITRASYNQGFAIDHAPERGTGGARNGIQPGWR